MENFQSLVKAVEENNEINKAQWCHWNSVEHIQEVYGQLEDNEFKEVAKAFLNALIRDEGNNLEIYLEAMDCLEYGYPFNRS